MGEVARRRSSMLLAGTVALVAACGRLGFDPEHAASSGRATEAFLATFTTTSTSFVDVPIQLTFMPAGPDEAWVLLVSAQLRGDTVSRAAAEARYFVNGVERGFGSGGGQLGSVSGWQHFDVVSNATGPQTVTVQLRLDTGPLAGIDQLRLVAFPLPAGVDAHFSEVDTAIAPVGDWAVYHALDLAPREPGDYLVLALVVGTEEPSAGVLRFRVRDPSGGTWPAGEYSNDRPPWHSFLAARSQAVGGPARFAVELKSNATTAASARDVRMLAVRTDAFASYESAADLIASTTTSPTPLVKSRLVTAAPSAERTYVVVQGIEVHEDAGGDLERGLRFQTASGSPIDYRYRTNNPNQRLGFGLARLVTTADSEIYENAFYSPSGQPIASTESVIHVLGLE